MESLIKPNEEILKLYGELKINRSIKGFILSLDSSNKELLIEKQFEKGSEFKEILDYLPKDDPR
jgi:hypothetical protein